MTVIQDSNRGDSNLPDNRQGTSTLSIFATPQTCRGLRHAQPLAIGCLVALLVSLGPWSVRAQSADSDPWFGTDKFQHFAISMAAGPVGFVAGMKLFPEADDAVWAASGMTLGLTLGLSKELLDLAMDKPFSYRDLTWDLAGTTVGTLLTWAVWGWWSR